jgi:hypothetical protein
MRVHSLHPAFLHWLYCKKEKERTAAGKTKEFPKKEGGFSKEQFWSQEKVPFLGLLLSPFFHKPGIFFSYPADTIKTASEKEDVI